MVKEILYKGQTYFQCPICGQAYADREWAEKCEEYCSTHETCSVEIMLHGVELPDTEEVLALG